MVAKSIHLLQYSVIEKAPHKVAAIPKIIAYKLAIVSKEVYYCILYNWSEFVISAITYIN